MLFTTWVLATAQARAKAAAARVRSRDSQPHSGRALLMVRSCGVLAPFQPLVFLPSCMLTLTYSMKGCQCISHHFFSATDVVMGTARKHMLYQHTWAHALCDRYCFPGKCAG